MKKIVLVSNYFNPCTLTPSQRISYWAENLHHIGVYPTVVTRDWTADIKSHFDTKKPIGDAVRYVKHEHYEVYYLPFKPGMLDRAYVKWGETQWRPLFLMTRLLDVLLVNFTLRFTSYSNFFPFIRELHQKETFDFTIISGEPFYLFKIGFLASKKLGVKWFADYRDDWSTNEIQRLKGNMVLRNIIFKVESIYERKWVRTAEKIISVSNQYTRRISDFLKLPGLTVENGFDEKMLSMERSSVFSQFTVTYSGTVYPAQNLQIILEALKISIKQGNPFRLVFLGSGFDIKEKKRIESKVDDSLRPYVEVTERMTRTEALTFLQKSHLLLGIAYGDLKGIPSSKIYEYVGLKKPVLLAPTDNDVMEEILTKVGLGFFAVSAEECAIWINSIRSMYESGAIKDLEEIAEGKILQYSRFNQVNKLKNLVNK